MKGATATEIESSSVLFDQWRPTSHFLGPHGWMNDPCGPSYDPRTGLYHLWYQWNPTASTWGNISWGHAYSRDMIHWTSRSHPVLSPGANHDSEGVFTGCVLQRPPLGTAEEAADSSEMTALYTAVSMLPIHHTLPYNYGCEKVVLSTSADGGETWTPHGIVVRGPPEHLDVISWRDPYIAQWPLLDTLLGRDPQTPGLYALIAGGIKDTTPTTFAYSINPADLSQWAYVGMLADVGVNCKAAPYGVDLGKNWEVANFFTTRDAERRAAEAEYLLINVEGCTEPGPARQPVYMKLDLEATRIGEDGEIRLQPANVGLLDHGCLYAASSFHDEKHDRRIMWGWITEDDLPESYYDKQGWAGLISLPRELFHHPTSSELGIRPAAEVEELRRGAQKIVFSPQSTLPGTTVELTEGAIGDAETLSAVHVPTITSRSYELEMDLIPAQPGVVVAHSEDLSTRTLIYVSASNHLVVDRTYSAGKTSVLAKDIKVNTGTLRASLSACEVHKLRMFVDNSVLEIFVDGLVAVSTRVYADAGDTGLSVLVGDGGEAKGEIRIWHGLDRAIVA
ncbi:glycosyl hydrolase [Pseudozyma hubeiensis SY62]|uniref:Glycosyl hydrolase n=1 Tax=Pseudozyma hubeiensis (strain SY62) TaxID=1305764 RepID=R9NYB5_PSEHS|nr:glycosyl hydrolase [Pseudozyma hubeiensis SY62]GAC93679.1 glycosyl hydrolase [Pseudozyma hubeiensis SY62]